MNKTYELGRDKTVFETAEFPTIAADEKVGIIFNGNIESRLLVIIAKKLYGIDRVVFISPREILFYEGKIFPASKDQNKLDFIKTKFAQDFKNLGGIHELYIGSEVYTANEPILRSSLKLAVKKYKNKLKFALAGYNKIHEQSMSMLKACGWDKGVITVGELIPWLEKNSSVYPELYRNISEGCGKIFGVARNVAFEQFEQDFNLCVRPFRNLETSQVIELYKQLNETAELYQSSNCIQAVGNCGICADCRERKFAFKNSSVADLTKYTFKSH